MPSYAAFSRDWASFSSGEYLLTNFSQLEDLFSSLFFEDTEPHVLWKMQDGSGYHCAGAVHNASQQSSFELHPVLNFKLCCKFNGNSNLSTYYWANVHLGDKNMLLSGKDIKDKKIGLIMQDMSEGIAEIHDRQWCRHVTVIIWPYLSYIYVRVCVCVCV